jgi:benzoate 4-monooxygenase
MDHVFLHGTAPFEVVLTLESKVHHAKKRRMLAHSYSLQSLVAMEEYVASGTRKYLAQMDRLATSGKPTNIKDWNHWYAFDTIGELALGDNFHLLDGSSNTDFVDLVAAHMKLGATFFCCQWLGKYIINPYVPLQWVQDALSRRQKLKRVTTTLIDQRLEKGSDRKDILARLIEARDPDTGEPLEKAELETEAWSNIVAGSDTTATSLTSIMFRVMKNPRIYEKLTAEIRATFPPHSTEIPTYAQTNKLPYLQACIKEALRVLPAIGRPLPRIVPPEGKTLAGETFPAGTIVGIPAWTVHRDRKVWGEDAEVYRPERWLEGDAAKYDRYFIPVPTLVEVC